MTAVSLPLLLLIVPLVAALACLLPTRQEISEWASGISAVVMAALGIRLAIDADSQAITAQPGLYLDALSAVLILVICVVGSVGVLYSLEKRCAESRRSMAGLKSGQTRWYYLWLNLFIFTMLLSALAANLGVLWIAMECSTVVSGALVGFYRKAEALEAALEIRHDLLTRYRSGPVRYCSDLLFGRAGAGPGCRRPELGNPARRGAAPGPQPGPSLLRIRAGGLRHKGRPGADAYLATPDAHSQAPSPVSAVLSAALLNCALYAILRFHAIAMRTLGPDFSSHLLLAFGLLSVAVAVPFLIIQHDLKRLLAYSSMEHIGIITTAVGIGGKLGLFAALLHMINHAAAKSAMFLGSGTLIQRLWYADLSIDWVGQAARNRVSATLLPFRVAWLWRAPLRSALSSVSSLPFGPPSRRMSSTWVPSSWRCLLLLSEGSWGILAGWPFGPASPHRRRSAGALPCRSPAMTRSVSGPCHSGRGGPDLLGYTYVGHGNRCERAAARGWRGRNGGSTGSGGGLSSLRADLRQ